MKSPFVGEKSRGTLILSVLSTSECRPTEVEIDSANGLPSAGRDALNAFRKGSMIDPSQLSHIFIRTKTKPGLEKTGITASVVLCFKTEPETSITLWHAKNQDTGQFEYATPAIALDSPSGQSEMQPCLAGGL